MRSDLRRRLDRLERGNPDSNGPPPWFWDWLGGTRPHDPGDEEVISGIVETAHAIAADRSEAQPAGKMYRRELTRLGLPQPDTLRGIDLIEECIQLAGQFPNALRELEPDDE